MDENVVPAPPESWCGSIANARSTIRTGGYRKHSLLLVDDDEALMAAMARVFRVHDYQVAIAIEAEEAASMIKCYRFSAIIADLELNSIIGLDGFSILGAVRQFSPTSKVLVYSGHSDRPTISATLNQGATKFLSKPAPLNELLESIEGLCYS